MSDNRERTDYFRRKEFYKKVKKNSPTRSETLILLVLSSYRLWKDIDEKNWRCHSVREMNKYPATMKLLRRLHGK